MIHDIVLETHGVRLEPLAKRHAEALAALVDDGIWAGMTQPLPGTPELMATYVEAARAAPDQVPFAVVSAADGVVRGSTRLYDLAPAQRRVEIGATFYGRDWWGGATNPACKYLLLRHAFEELGLQRVALRGDSRNTRSLAAMRRLGATQEGVLRAHRIAPDGSTGDSVYFSILADEWPAVRDGLLARLASIGATAGA
ncbi:GNAT family N-acetyltransferase [Antribacter sp. KLBMP9083]|uniref:GNAT family N-acetyltransferase n=1 Tax=Antribacter soli TaxID=2910976 RepID=A0AA41QEI1_9MICO|nr:GNAT family protein [Antribacter soli]MCF4120657.1 GNAT family N-acetyltransferase [Antribacter soli]